MTNREIATELIKSIDWADPHKYVNLADMIERALDDRVDECAKICEQEAEDFKSACSWSHAVGKGCAKLIRKLNA